MVMHVMDGHVDARKVNENFEYLYNRLPLNYTGAWLIIRP